MKKAKLYFEVGNSCGKAVRGERKNGNFTVFHISLQNLGYGSAQERKNSKEIVLEKTTLKNPLDVA